jgi:hypothetical protein
MSYHEVHLSDNLFIGYILVARATWRQGFFIPAVHISCTGLQAEETREEIPVITS